MIIIGYIVRYYVIIVIIRTFSNRFIKV